MSIYYLFKKGCFINLLIQKTFIAVMLVWQEYISYWFQARLFFKNNQQCLRHTVIWTWAMSFQLFLPQHFKNCNLSHIYEWEQINIWYLKTCVLACSLDFPSHNKQAFSFLPSWQPRFPLLDDHGISIDLESVCLQERLSESTTENFNLIFETLEPTCCLLL